MSQTGTLIQPTPMFRWVENSEPTSAAVVAYGPSPDCYVLMQWWAEPHTGGGYWKKVQVGDLSPP